MSATGRLPVNAAPAPLPDSGLKPKSPSREPTFALRLPELNRASRRVRSQDYAVRAGGSLSNQMQDDLSVPWRPTMLEKVDALPCAQRHVVTGDGNAELR